MISISIPMVRFCLCFAFVILVSANPKLINSWDETAIRFEPLSPSPAPEPSPDDDDSSVSCVDDLGGVGSLDSTCKLVADLNLTRDLNITGKGNLHVLPGVRLVCQFPGCSISVNISGNFSLAENSSVIAGTFRLAAENAEFGLSSAVDTTGLAGEPPPDTSGTPEGVEGAGGGYGGRGACCLSDTTTKIPEDVFGGDVYGWSSLEKPEIYGSRGGSTSNEVDYGGGGGGTVAIEILGYISLNGSVLADGASGGVKGGGGSGGSIFVMAHKMAGNGRLSASGGDGYAGGGGGRVSVDIYSRHSDPKIFFNGGRSFGCPENAGAAGTLYDVISESLTIDNHNKTTYTDTLLLEFPNHRLFTNLYIRNMAKVAVPLRWSRVQVQGLISLSNGGELNFGLPRYASSEFELFAEELLMSNSAIKVYGALRMTVKVFLMLKSRMFIDGGGVTILGTSMLEISNLLVLKESSVIQSNGNLGVHGQGLLNLTGTGDTIEAQRLILSLFYSIQVGAGAVLRGPLQNASTGGLTPKLYCQRQDCPVELLHPPEDCNVNSSLPFTLQICRVEDITVEGLIKGSVIQFHLARTVLVRSSGTISADGMGCKGGVGTGRFLRSGIGSGGGHGGKGGSGCYNHTCIEGGESYGNADLPCELGSGSGNEESTDSVAGGGIIVLGSLEHPLSSLSLEGSITTDGESPRKTLKGLSNSSLGPGGGSGGTVLLFLRTLEIGRSAILSSIGGNGSLKGGGGGSGGRIHFHWSDIPTGDVYHPVAIVKGRVYVRGGMGIIEDNIGGNGTLTGKACPEGLYGLFCEECPSGTYKNVTGSDKALCHLCPANDIPHRAVYVTVRGGVAETPCPYKCISDRYHMPHCYTTLEELIYTFGGPWLFGVLLVVVLLLLALVFSVARMKFVSGDELHGSAPTQHGSQIDHSFPFLESLNEVMETSRVEESQGHMHRIYFLGPNTFSEPWHLSHTPPEEIKEIVYEAAFNGFVDEVNVIAAYQWWEGAIYIMLSVLVYPLAWSWQQSRRRLKFQKLRDFVRSEYDHSCLRSCRSRALYEGLKVAATPDLMLAHLDFFLGGDEKRSDLPPQVHQRLPMPLIFGGDGSYMAYYSLQSDDILTSLLSQLVPPTTWYRFVAGLNAQLRLVQQGKLRSTFRSVMRWIETHGNPALKRHGVRVDLARFQALSSSSCQYGILVHTIADEVASTRSDDETEQQHPWGTQIENHSGDFRENFQPLRSEINHVRHQECGEIIDIGSLQFPEPSTPGSKVLNKFLSSKQKLFSLTLSPPTQKSLLFSPTSGSNLQDDGSQLSADDNKIFKRLIPSPKVRDALLFRKSADKEDEECEKDGFFKRLLRDSRGEDDEQRSNSEGFFKRLLKDNKSEEEEISNNSEGFFKRLRSSKGDEEELTSSSDGFFKRLLRDNKGDEEELGANSEGFFKKLLRDSKNEDEEPNANTEGFFKKLFHESKNEDDKVSNAVDDEEKDGFLKKLFKEKFDEKRNGNERNETDETVYTDETSGEDNGREGFFKKLFKEKFEDKPNIGKADDGNESEDDESSEFSLFRRLFRRHPEDVKTTLPSENCSNGGFVESSPGTENFFRKLFRDRDRSVEDSELFGSKKYKEKCPGSPKPQNNTPSKKPPLPNNTAAQFRKGSYHESLEFVHALCETSYDLVDIFPIEDRKTALRESIAEINSHLAQAETTGGICFPMGRGVYRVVNIPEDEYVLLNSREKVPYMICVEVLKAETPCGAKTTSTSLKLSKGGIPLANGDAFLHKPPPWAYPLSTAQEVYRNSADRMSLSTVEAIDQAMTHKSEVKLVNACLSVETHSNSNTKSVSSGVTGVLRTGLESDLEWVRLVLTADPGLRMESITDPKTPRRKEHRRVSSIVAYEEVRAAAAKGEAPPGLPLKGAGQDSSDAQPMANGGMLKAGDALSGEFWEGKRLRIRKDSIYGNLPGWDLRSIIVKSGDDCRQEHLAVQLISHFFDIFQEAGLPLWLRPYEVLVTSSYTALIETIPDTASIHSIKSRYPNITSLRDFFDAKFKENSPSFKLAQRNFVESMAGYSLVCYLLQIKDRHNGNLLMDEEGHIIHIDFGFMLSNSPGGVNFESAPFKLTRELLEVMDSDAEGLPSEFFDYFKVLCIQGFLTCRKHAERIILLVEMLQDSGFPCFKGGPRTIQNLRKRFHLSLTEEQCVSLVLSLISSSLDAWRTRQYDYYQRVLNGIR